MATGSGSYRLCLGWHDRVDADHFEAAAAMALRAHGANRRAQLEHALSCWAGEPLPEERESPWAQEWRERLLARHDALLGALADLPHYRRAPSTARPTAHAF